MCSDNLTSTNNNGVINSDSQQRCETAEKCCLSAGDHTSKLNINALNSKSPYQEANETFKKKHIKPQAMAEKTKKLPPGYENVTMLLTTNAPISSPNVDCNEKSVKDAKHVYYVNTEVLENVDLQSEKRNESQISLNPGIVYNDTNKFKIGRDPVKPEIPFNDSYPINSSIAPPPKQKLSQQKTIASPSPQSSGEFRRKIHYINNEISNTSDIINDDEMSIVDQVPVTNLWYGRTKSRSFPSTFVISEFSQLTDDTKENNGRYHLHNGTKIQSPSKSSSSPLLHYGAVENETHCEDSNNSTLKCGDSKNNTVEEMHIEQNTPSPNDALNDLIYLSNCSSESSVNEENVALVKTGVNELYQTTPNVRPSSFQSTYLDSPYQNTDNSAKLNESHSDGNKRMLEIVPSSSSPFSTHSSQPSSISNVVRKNLPHLKQYIHSAGGGCVSPVSDSSPHILITSQNYFSHDHPANSELSNNRFSVTNPFLPLLKNKELEVNQARTNNPFLWISPHETESKSQTQIVPFSHTAPTGQFPSQLQFQTEAANDSSSNFSSSVSTENSIIQQHHIHHHHFFHPCNQTNANTLSGPIRTVNNHFNDIINPEPALSPCDQGCVALSPPPSVPFPRTDSLKLTTTNNQDTLSPNRNVSRKRLVGGHANIQLVLKPKKEPLSYKDLENILSKNKALLIKSGWYYGKMKADESTALLSDTPAGTFLVRDSSDPKYWFSLSMQRGNNMVDIEKEENTGPTSIRIHFVNGKFQLDAEDRIRNIMPEFDTIVDLVQYYVSTSIREFQQFSAATSNVNEKSNIFQNAKSQTLWVDSSGQLYQTIFLADPLYKKDHTRTLSHLCRLSINASIISKITNESKESIYDNNQYLDSISKLNLPFRIKNYLQEYPNNI